MSERTPLVSPPWIDTCGCVGDDISYLASVPAVDRSACKFAAVVSELKADCELHKMLLRIVRLRPEIRDAIEHRLISNEITLKKALERSES